MTKEQLREDFAAQQDAMTDSVNARLQLPVMDTDSDKKKPALKPVPEDDEVHHSPLRPSTLGPKFESSSVARNETNSNASESSAPAENGRDDTAADASSAPAGALIFGNTVVPAPSTHSSGGTAASALAPGGSVNPTSEYNFGGTIVSASAAPRCSAAAPATVCPVAIYGSAVKDTTDAVIDEERKTAILGSGNLEGGWHHLYGVDFYQALSSENVSRGPAKIAKVLPSIAKSIVQVDAGQDSNFILTKQGSVFSFGQPNATLARKVCASAGSHGEEIVLEPGMDTIQETEAETEADNSKADISLAVIQVKLPEKVVRLSASGAAVLFLSENGKVYFAGNVHDDDNNKYCPPAAGNGNQTRGDMQTPYKLDIPPAAAIFAGASQCIIVLKDNALLSFGGTNEYGQLGRRASEVQDCISPGLVDLSKLGEGNNVVSVAIGAFHMIVATKNGEVFGSGMNSFGQLGVPTVESEDRNIMVKTDFLRAKQVAAGDSTTHILNRMGEIFSCGKASDGNLGIGAVKKMCRDSPTLAQTTESEVKFKEIGAKGNSLWAHSELGDLFVAGPNEDCQIGLEAEDYVHTLRPLEVSDFDLEDGANMQVMQFATGNMHALMLLAQKPPPTAEQQKWNSKWKWRCKACTANQNTGEVCQCCKTPRPANPERVHDISFAPPKKALKEDEEKKADGTKEEETEVATPKSVSIADSTSVGEETQKTPRRAPKEKKHQAPATELRKSTRKKKAPTPFNL